MSVLEGALNYELVVKPSVESWLESRIRWVILHGPAFPKQASKESSMGVHKADGRQQKITPFLSPMTPVRGQSDGPPKTGVGTLFFTGIESSGCAL